MPEITDIVETLPRNPLSLAWRERPLHAITLIVVHYDAVDAAPPGAGGAPGYDPVERYRAQAVYHMRRNWNRDGSPAIHGFGLMYHYRVSADGRIWRTQPEELITWHAREANYRGLAICCDLGPGQTPPQAQVRGLSALLGWLCTERPDIPAARPDVYGHGELTADGNRTPCPGNFREWVQAYRKGLVD